MPTASSALPAAPTRWWRLALPLLLALLLAACSGVKLVADHDADAAQGITATSAEVFAFYDRLIEAKAQAAGGKLAYAAFADDWGRIETRLRVLLVREDARALNEESQRIARTLLGFWQKYRASHRDKDDYVLALARIHRDRFQRLFTAALVAEKAKALARPDSDTAAEPD